MRGAEFSELRTFVEVARSGSFSRASAILGVSPSAVSQTIRALEERLGVRLFNRTTRAVACTELGVRLLAEVSPLLDGLENAVQSVGALHGEPRGPLRINAPRIAAMAYIAPILADFCRTFPRVELELCVADTLDDIVTGRFDAGIRIGERVARDMVTLPLSGDLRMCAVAAPSYLRRRGVPLSPAALKEHDCIRFRWPSDGHIYRWEFDDGRRGFDVDVAGSFITNDGEIMLQAATDGIGIAYCMNIQARAALDNGTLVEILKDFAPSFPGFQLYYAGARQSPPALRALVDFLRARLPA